MVSKVCQDYKLLQGRQHALNLGTLILQGISHMRKQHDPLHTSPLYCRFA